ncbi:MAG: hypothetical protein ACP5GS_06080, partial [Nitrososphaeria archaeon]
TGVERKAPDEPARELYDAVKPKPCGHANICQRMPAQGETPLATAIHSAKVAEAKSGESAIVTGAGGGVGIH